MYQFKQLKATPTAAAGRVASKTTTTTTNATSIMSGIRMTARPNGPPINGNVKPATRRNKKKTAKQKQLFHILEGSATH